MKKFVCIEPKWLSISTGIFAIILGGCLILGANGLGCWMGLIILICGIFGTAYEIKREKEIISISDENICFGRIQINPNELSKVERDYLNETVFFKLYLKNKEMVMVQAPYWHEREAWAALQELTNRSA